MDQVNLVSNIQSFGSGLQDLELQEFQQWLDLRHQDLWFSVQAKSAIVRCITALPCLQLLL